MSSLNQLLEKLASEKAKPLTPVSTSSGNVDLVYVEKLASAVEFIVEQENLHTQKVANVDKVKANLSKGMSLEEAVKAAYPDASPEELANYMKMFSGGAAPAPKPAPNKLKALLMARKPEKKAPSAEEAEEGGEASPEEEEKAASAISKIAVSRLRSSLKTKLAARTAEQTEQDFELIDSVLSKLRNLTSSTSSVEDSNKIIASAEESAEVADENSEVSGDNLAEMLGETDNAGESTSEGSTKTAVDQSGKMANLLKGSLLKKVAGKESRL